VSYLHYGKESEGIKMLKNYIKIARPDHWVKNAFIIPGIVVAWLVTDGIELSSELLFKFIFGLIATCFIASANYVINEWLDAEFDKYHPTKKNRPVVSENMKATWVYLEYILLICLGVGLSFAVNKFFVYVEIWLLVMGVIYNVKPMRSKDVPYLDVLSESINNMIRLLLGWFIVTSAYLPPVSILIGYWFGGAFLMAIKRLAEYRMIGDSERAGLYRKSFKSYTERSLLVSSFFYASTSIFFTGIFLIKYRMEYIFAMPLVFGLFCLYLSISFKPDSAVQKPEKLYKEKGLIAYVLVLVIALVILSLVDIDLPISWTQPALLEL